MQNEFSEPSRLLYFRHMIRTLFILVGIFFLISCQSKQGHTAQRSEEELIALLHGWSNSDSLQNPEIADKYSLALSEFLSQYPNNPEHENFLFLAGQQAVKQKDFATAASYYAQFANSYPNSRSHADALFAAGFLYNNEVHNIDSATKYYSMFIDLYPEHMLKDAAESELEHLGESPEQMLEKFKTNQDSAKEPLQ
ncbi:MAG: tetratricopeptide repeat protein [Bacteroidetes bacterium]|nr:tetratricopeptide repeat protein [Bacteroidota bacterium]